MKTILAIAIALCTTVSAYAEAEWVEIASSKMGRKWELQKDSLELTKNQGEESIAVMNGRVMEADKIKTRVYKWYVSINDCNRKMGKLAILNTTGEFEHEQDFIFGGADISSVIAEKICYNADPNKMREKKLKSLKPTS